MVVMKDAKSKLEGEGEGKRENNGVSWRTFILGGMLGYVMALMTIVMVPKSQVGLRRFLTHHEEGGEVEGTTEGSEWKVEASEEGEEDEEEEHEVDSSTFDTIVAAIVVLLIVLTIIFEEVKEHIEHTAPRSMKPIIASLFGEMTVLGFLSIFTFCLTQLGWFEELSIRIFGHEEEEELLEMFEQVHYMLFFIMVFFVSEVLLAVGRAKKHEQKWRIMNKASQDEKYMEQVYSIDGGYHPTNYFAYLCNSIIPRSEKRRFISELKLFAAVREEFILERSIEPPFAPQKQLADDFHFGRYLGINLAHTLQHSVHLQPQTWLFFGFLTVVVALVMWAVENKTSTFAWIWVAIGWAFFLLARFFDYHLLKVLEAMAAPKSQSSNGSTGESDSLLDSSLPAWTKIEPPNEHVNRQEGLFWFGKSSHKIYDTIMQIRLLFVSVYLTLLILTIYPHIFAPGEYSPAYIVGFVILSLFPISFRLLKSELPDAALAVALSIGVHRRPNVIAQTIREEKTDKLICALVFGQKLKSAARDGFVAPSTVGSVDSSSGVLADVSKTFDTFDTSGDGKIDADELKAIMSAVGAVPPSSDAVDKMLGILDTNNDGHIDKNEFLAFYMANVVISPDKKSLTRLAGQIFEDFDVDNSGEITLTEFKDILDSFDVKMTLDEIGLLVNELDEHDDGTISGHEFFELLEKHKRLFEDETPPPLTL